MALDRDELARRIVAARGLRGLDQSDLHGPMVKLGFGKHDLARLERADPKLPLSPPRRRALSELLDVPEWWFTASEEEVWGQSQQEDGFAEVARRLASIERRLDQMSREGVERDLEDAERRLRDAETDAQEEDDQGGQEKGDGG